MNVLGRLAESGPQEIPTVTTHFKLYPKISTTGNSSDVARNRPWVALEKIHGAQLVIQVAADGMSFGKRKAWLQDTDLFFGWQLIRHTMAESARALYDVLGIAGTTITIYGELFGGKYPHPSVHPVPGMAPVQTGIWYTPELHYAVFDIHLSSSDHDEGELFSHSEVVELALSASFLSVPVIAKGLRHELESLPVRFPTRVPAIFGLPPMENNWAEGMVLKADARSTLSNRAIIKRKIPEFDEAIFDESMPWDPDQHVSVEDLAAWVVQLINAPRIASARSKWGYRVTDQLIEEIVLDVLVDLELAFPRAFHLLGPEDEALLQMRARDHVLSIVDHE